MDSPADFSKYNLNTIRHAEHFLQKYKNLFEWNAPEDMLEIGGGDGRVTNNVVFPFVEKHLNSLLGSDLSQEAVDVANKMHSKPNLSYVQMDIGDPKSSEKYAKKFGHIFSFYCFQMVRSSQVWAKSVFNMLKPNGQVLATLTLAPNAYTKIIDEQKADKSSPWVKYVENSPNLFVEYGPNPIETVSNILKNAGFTINAIDVEFVDVVFTDDESFRGTFASVNHVVKNVPEELRGAYMEDYLDKWSSYAQKDEKGHYNSKFSVLVFLASKK